MVQVEGRRSPKWAFMSKMVIPSKKNEGETYLVRWRLVQTPWFGIFLHRIDEPDFDRDPHDHPWNFISIILRGQYTEEIWYIPSLRFLGAFQDGEEAVPVRRRWLQGTWHKMTTEKAHRINDVKKGTLTLILVGRRFRQWGFWTHEGWVPWTTYLDEAVGSME